jgi:hypothetical protein
MDAVLSADIRDLLGRAERCHKEMALEYYNAYSGRQDRLDIASVLARFPELHDLSTYRFVAGLDDTALPDPRLRRFLRMAFAGFFLHKRLKDLTESIANAEAEATVEVDGQTIGFRSLPGTLANEPDYELRGRLDRAYVEVIAQLNPQRAALHSRTREAVAELGFTDVPAMAGALKYLEPHKLAADCREYLERSAAFYEERLGFYARQAGLSRDSVRHADTGYILRAERYDELFPPKQMLPALSRTLGGLGIDLEAQDNVMLDLEPRPRKSPRAFCIGIDVPKDVRLVLSPRGGQDDFAVLFHEAGHLEFAAHIDGHLPYVYRQHGDLSVHEGFAFLFQHLTAEPAWWHEVMGADPGDYPAFARFNRLYLFRRYCAKLNYELEFYTAGGGPEMAAVYAAWLERGCHFTYPAERYLSDFDAELYVMQYLQAWIWEVQLRQFLVDEFGETWFLKRKAGDLLRGLWRDGMKYDVWELARLLGLNGLEISALEADLARP